MDSSKTKYILFSGGLDSYNLLVHLKLQNSEIVPIFIDKDQKAKTGELRSVEKICKEFGLKYRVLKVPFIFRKEDKNELLGSYPYLRNLVFLSLVSMHVLSRNEEGELLVGFTLDDQNRLDTSEIFIQRLNELLVATVENNENYEILKVYAPLIKLDKKTVINNIIELISQDDSEITLEVYQNYLHETWSCYEYSSNGHCKECDGCKSRKVLENYD